ncbi:MAG: hypothetical protein H6908_03800 [Hyphomicrobiales bacterium]|nr:hypothetical protein [Hyphomicrobiales bacterium]
MGDKEIKKIPVSEFADINGDGTVVSAGDVEYVEYVEYARQVAALVVNRLAREGKIILDAEISSAEIENTKLAVQQKLDQDFSIYQDAIDNKRFNEETAQKLLTEHNDFKNSGVVEVAISDALMEIHQINQVVITKPTSSGVGR